MNLRLLFAFAGVALIAACPLFITGQTVVPVVKEPHHHLLFENRYVRVLDVVFPPGDASLFHTHTLDNVSVVIASGTTRSDRMDAMGVPQVVPVGRIVFNSATPPYTHRVTNTGNTLVRIFDVELLASASAWAPTSLDELTRHVVALENEHVRVTRIALSPGESLPPHSHARGWLVIDVTGATAGHVEWHDAATIAPAIAGESTRRGIVEIEPK